MTKQALIAELQNESSETSFLANLIQTQHKNPNRKLKGLRNLLKAGHEVRTAQFDSSVLVIDGCRASWIVLEEWEARRQ